MRKLFLPGEITDRHNCCDRTEPLRRHPANPVLTADRPWEDGLGYPCVIYSADERKFRMWYEADKLMADKHDPSKPLIDGAPRQHEMYLCYAESTDGLQWEKPVLNRLKVEQYGDNNIVKVDSGFIGGQGSVIDDINDPDPTRRFKLAIYDNDGKGRDGLRTAVSPNGVDWSFVGDFPVLPSQDTPSLWHDRERGRYVAFLKTRLDGKRARMISISEDFKTWSEPRMLLAPDLADPPTLEFYAQYCFHHWGHDLGLLSCYDLATQRSHMELIAAADGTDWRRLPTRTPILLPGEIGGAEGGGVYPGTGVPVEVGGEYWLYYCGTNQRHSGEDSDLAKEVGFGVATFAPGRLAGQQFTGDGWCQTIPFRCLGGRLTLNAVARCPMTLEIHSAGYGGPIAGFTRQESTAVTGDSCEHLICWSNRQTLNELRDRFIQLRVYGSKGTVFGIAIKE